ncbi:hypothetical protein V8687_18290 [Shewanella baltica]|uniref:hypothetical protein n=1 Tax=Shewanella baltica TaxID=62322 RepID=UPI0030CB00E5
MEMTAWIQVVIGLVGIVLAILVPVFVYLNNTSQRTRHELSEHKTHVAEKYATKDDIKELGDRMERQMRNGFDNLKELLTNRKDKDAA